MIYMIKIKGELITNKLQNPSKGKYGDRYIAYIGLNKDDPVVYEIRDAIRDAVEYKGGTKLQQTLTVKKLIINGDDPEWQSKNKYLKRKFAGRLVLICSSKKPPDYYDIIGGENLCEFEISVHGYNMDGQIGCNCRVVKVKEIKDESQMCLEV